MSTRFAIRSAVVCALALTVVPLTAAAGARVPQIDVSRAAGSQWEVAVTTDPRSPRRLLAASNQDFRSGVPLRYYTSANGGVSWTSANGPMPLGLEDRCTADPAPAVGPDGRQYLAFLALDCSGVTYQSLFVSTRANASSPWSQPTAPVVPAQAGIYDDKDGIAVDTLSKRFRGRVYVVWSRGSETANQESFGPSSILLSHSEDGGATWSAPVTVGTTSRPETLVTFSAVSVARNGDVYVSWDLAGTRTLWLARSTDGGASFPRRVRAAKYGSRPSERCFASGTSIAAQPVRCVGPSPALAVDRSAVRSAGRVYVAYMTLSPRNRSTDVYVHAFSPTLRSLGAPRRIGRAERGSLDQFQPALAVDAKSGALWACFYQATGARARFSCTLSRTGGRTWTGTVAAASTPSNETQPGALPFEYGEYQGLAVAGGTAHPLWTDSRRLGSLREEIYATVLRERSLR